MMIMFAKNAYTTLTAGETSLHFTSRHFTSLHFTLIRQCNVRVLVDIRIRRYYTFYGDCLPRSFCSWLGDCVVAMWRGFDAHFCPICIFSWLLLNSEVWLIFLSTLLWCQWHVFFILRVRSRRYIFRRSASL